MCLFIGNKPTVESAIKYTDKEEIFYKVLLKDKMTGSLKTAFRNMDVVLNVPMEDSNTNFEFEWNTWRIGTGWFVGGGGFHLFAEKRDAMYFANHWNADKAGFAKDDAIVVEAVVPKETKYIKGTFDTIWGDVTKNVVVKRVTYRNEL